MSKSQDIAIKCLSCKGELNLTITNVIFGTSPEEIDLKCPLCDHKIIFKIRAISSAEPTNILVTYMEG